MATISLYAGKINNMPGLIKDFKKSVSDYKNELFNLKRKSQQVNRSICNLDDAVNAISASTKFQEEKITSLESFKKNSEQFIADTVRIDGDVADIVNQRKNDFYNRYSYLKPECEKSGWEKFCDGVKAVCEWCKDNWKSIVKIIAAIVIIAALGIASVLTGGALAVILAGAFWGALIGGALGGIMGGITNVISGGSFLEGFADGALSGTISGAISGAVCAGIGLAGQAFSKGISCVSRLGKVIKVTSKVTSIISLGMDGFDMVAMGIGFFDPNNPIVQLNQKLHSSALYNLLQIGINGLAIFTGAATTTMTCFVAGTMILTATGLVAIERIKAGDIVISRNPETMEVETKSVVEAYIREDSKLIHLVVNGEEIITTETHPFYVNKRGFVNAGELKIGDELLDSNNNILLLEDYRVELTDKPTTVYNFQVEDFHTYFVGENGIWVHNADCSIEFSNKSGLDEKEFKQQLADQQDGLNNMTVEEYQHNRALYEANGRASDSSKFQQNARNEAISNRIAINVQNGMSYDDACKEAASWIKGKAALHSPDQIAGGSPSQITGLGDSRINSSIGSQWKADSRIGLLNAYVDELASRLTPAETRTTLLNVELILK